MIDHSRSQQYQEDSRRQGPQKHKEKKTIADKQPSASPKAKKHKPLDSDEDDEEPLNEPGTSSHSQLTVPVLPLHQEPAARSQGPAAIAISGDEDSEYSDEYSTQNQDSGRTVLYPDFNVLTNDELWAMTPETLKYAAAAGSFCFVTTENGDQQDMCNLTTLPCVQRSLYLNEMTNNFGNRKFEVPEGVDGRTRDVLEQCMTNCGKAAGIKARRRCRARKEASAQEVRGYYKQFAEAKHLEHKSWVDNEVFDLVDLRKIKPRTHVTRRWVLTIKTDKQGNFLKAKARWVLRGFQHKQKEYQQTDSLASTIPRFRMNCQVAAGKIWNTFPINLKTAFIKLQSYGVNRDAVCQLPPEAGHPPNIAARLEKPAYGTNDAPQRWCNILDKALCGCGMVPTRADRCCYVLCPAHTRERTWNRKYSTQWHNYKQHLY